MMGLALENTEVANLLTSIHKGFKENIGIMAKLAAEMPQVDLSLQHTFADGLYARSGLIPKGTIVVGFIHKTSQLFIVIKGKLSIATENGVETVEAGHIGSTYPGMSRVGYAHEDTIAISILATNETEVEEIERMYIAKTYEEFEAYIADNSALTVEEKGV